MAEMGYIALILAFIACILSIAAYVFGLRSKRPDIVGYAGKGAIAAGVFFTVSIITMIAALVSHNFQIEYVAQYTSTDMALPYLVSTLWAGNAGSLFFWGWIISLAAAAVVIIKQKQGQELVPYAALIVVTVQAFFLALLIFTQNPFNKLSFIPVDGNGLNPLLENPGMIFHPPMLLAGFAVFVVPFAFAAAALLTNRLNADWLGAIRKWALLGWLLLGVGNLIGAWWAYAELGWGGYWAWDPVENAGLMPWLIATALIHSIMLQKRKGMFKLWNMSLVMLTFILTIFGTFITRSDVLSSVHTFGETAVGTFFLAFLIISIVSSIALLIWRRKELKDDAEMGSFFSSEGAFMLNNILLFAAAFVVFWGTIFPSLSEAVSGNRIEINSTFYTQTAIPLLLAIVLLSGICIIIGWKQLSGVKLGKSMLAPAAAGVTALVLALIFGMRHWAALIIFFICGFVIYAIASQWLREVSAFSRTKAIGWFNAGWKLLCANRKRYGGLLVHISIVIITIGMVGSSLFDVEVKAELMPGEQMSIEGYDLTYNWLVVDGSATRMIITADMDAYKDGKSIGKIEPEVIYHANFEQPVTEVAIRTTPAEDLYMVLASWQTVTLEDGSEAVRAGFIARVNPLVVWIWIGGFLLLFGGLIAFWPGSKD